MAGIKNQTLILLIALCAGCCAQVCGQAPLKNAKGDPSVHLEFHKSPEDLLFKLDEADQIIGSSINCAQWQAAGTYHPAAARPAKVTQLLKGKPQTFIKWAKDNGTPDPQVVATKHAVIVSMLRGLKARYFSPAELTLALGPLKKRVPKVLSPAETARALSARYLSIEAELRDLLCLHPGSANYVKPDKQIAGHFGSAGRSEFYFFPETSAYTASARFFFNASGSKASWWWLKETETVVAALDAGVPKMKPEELLARFDFMIAHNLLYQYRGFYHYLPAWIPHGLGHWFERRRKGSANTYLIMGLPTAEYRRAWEFDSKDYWRTIKSEVRSNRTIPWLKLAGLKSYGSFPPKAHIQSWSMVNFLFTMGNERFRTFIDIMTRHESSDLPSIQVQNTAFIKSYGATTVEMEKAWKKWVLKTKPGQSLGK